MSRPRQMRILMESSNIWLKSRQEGGIIAQSGCLHTLLSARLERPS